MDQATIQTYDRYAKEYDDEVIEFWNNFPSTTINEFCKRLKGKKVLDLGSGSGRDALILKANGLNVVCVDASAEMVKITRQLGFETIESDFNNLKLDDNSFDGVWAYTSLLHLKKNEMIQVIKNIYKILPNNGMFLIGMIEGNYEGEVQRENMPGEKRYFKYYEENELREMIENLGFTFEFQERYKPQSKTYLAQIYKKN